MLIPVCTVARAADAWFVAKDLCDALELDNKSRALSRLEDNEKAEVTLSNVSSNGVTQQRLVSIVSEFRMYSLVLSSRKPETKAFRKWFTKDVLPTIRKPWKHKVRTHESRSA